jgi:hypothetical protein
LSFETPAGNSAKPVIEAAAPSDVATMPAILMS